MTLPIYRKITVKSSQPRLIHAQLDQLDFGENPFIIQFAATIKSHRDCIKSIENYFEEHEINTFSYPIYIVTDNNDYLCSLNLIKNAESAPSFFRHKSKQLSAKENQKLAVIQLKQLRLNGLTSSEFNPIIEEYAKCSKKISLINNEIEFYKFISDKIKGHDSAKK